MYKALKTGVLVMTLTLGGITAAQEYPCAVYLNSARIYLKQSTPDNESARKNLEAAYQKCYENAELHYLLGLIYADDYKIDKMVTELGIARKQGYAKPEEIKKVLESKWVQEFQAGTKALEQTDTATVDSVRTALQAQAARYFESCLMIDSTRFQPYVNAAAQLIEMNKLEKADTLLSKAYSLVPESLNVILSYGINLYNLERYDQAIEIFQKAVAIDPNNSEALINLASLYGLKGDREKSREMWDILIEKGMANKDVYFNRGLVFLIEAQDLTTKINTTEDSLAKNPKNEAWKKQMAALSSEKNKILSKAEQDFSRSVELDSQDMEAVYQLGFVLLLEGKLDESMQNLEKVTQMKEDHKAAWEALTVVYTKRGMMEKAREADAKSRP